MKSTLETLIQLAELEVDDRRLELKEIQEREDMIVAKKQGLADQVESEKIVAQESIEAGFAYGQFVNWAKSERERLDNMIVSLQPEIEGARNRLSEAFAEQKKVEITKERRDIELQEKRKAKEQEFLDEFTTTQFHRKDK